MRSSPKENQSLEVKVKGISEMDFSLSIFDYTFTNYCVNRSSPLAQLDIDRLKWSKLTYLLAHVSPRQPR